MMINKNAYDVEMVNPDADDDSSLNNMTTSSDLISGAELLDTSIEDIRNNKKTMVSTIDSVTSLMNEVEYEEKAAEQAKKEAAQSCSDIMLKAYELSVVRQQEKKKNDMLAREACLQKKLLSTKMEALQLHVTSLLDKGDGSLSLLDEMSRSLEMRLTSAIMEKKLAIKKKKENEAFAQVVLACQEIQMAKVEEESKRLKQEAVEISKFQEFLIDRGHLVTMLNGEISDKCQYVKQLKEELDQVVPPGVKISSSRKSSSSDSSSSSLVSSIIPCQPQPEPADSDVLLKKGSGFGIGGIFDDHGVADITGSIKKVKIKGKLYANQMFAKCIKKVKIKGKVYGNERFAKNTKKMKIKSKLHGNQKCAKSIKKLKIKGKWHGSHVCAKSIKKLKIKDKRHGNQMCAKSIKKLKIHGKQHGSQMRAKCIKKVKITSKLHGNQLCPKSIKNLKITSKLHGNQLCPKSIKKVKIKRKQQGCQICYKSIKKVKIKGLQVV